jgi:hypothetical protein
MQMLHQNPNRTPPLNTSVRDVHTMHGDTSSSDCSALNGPGIAKDNIDYKFHEGMATFPTILLRRDGNLMALASSFRQHPVRKEIEGNEDAKRTVTAEVWLIDGDSGLPMCHPRAVPQSSIFGGVYAYLDQSDDGLVVTSTTTTDDGAQLITKILKYTARRGPKHELSLEEPEELADISVALASRAARNGDSIVSLSPDKSGAIWFVTAQGNVGISGPYGGVKTPLNFVSIEGAEAVNNSFSTVRHPWLGDLAALTTNKALYVFMKNEVTGAPEMLHRMPYAIGTGPDPKPGQLAYPPSIYLPEEEQQLYGTGSTPSFFGPEHGAEWVTITDNATDALNLLVFDVATGEQIATSSLFQDRHLRAKHARATENSCIAYKNSVIIPSTAGYPYPVPPKFKHKDAHFVGGITRVDISADTNGVFTATPIWTKYHRSAAVPRLCVNEGLIYTITRHPGGNVPTDIARLRDTFSYTVIDFETGRIKCEIPLEMMIPSEHPHLPPEVLHGMGNPLQMTCCMAVDSAGAPVMWQGTMSGYYRISGPAS